MTLTELEAKQQHVTDVLFEKFGVQCDLPERDFWFPIARTAIQAFLETRKIRSKIGHRSDCIKINCFGCGTDFYSEDFR